ncbi:hypothetical protein N3K66_000888 [Trichothecium roseum]|uniref:Uncharacterized protein n=1 Tax=Trichothecium roseum TaxID=47278 RepID=A0ACC0VD77_9HYPO|nr:hypothetical protein N3K66_000888 [Trichothecium roseum]
MSKPTAIPVLFEVYTEMYKLLDDKPLRQALRSTSFSNLNRHETEKPTTKRASGSITINPRLQVILVQQSPCCVAEIATLPATHGETPLR